MSVGKYSRPVGLLNYVTCILYKRNSDNNKN